MNSSLHLLNFLQIGEGTFAYETLTTPRARGQFSPLREDDK